MATSQVPDSTWWWVAVGLTGVTALLGLLDPGLALRALLVMLIGVAFVVLARAVMAALRRIRAAGPSMVVPAPAPFGAVDREQLPFHLALLRPQPALQPGGPDILSYGARMALRTIATERLWGRHRINLWAESHQEHARALMSDRLWSAVNAHHVDQRPIPQQTLTQLLDELEQL